MGEARSLAGQIAANAPVAVRESRRVVLAASRATDDELWAMSLSGMATAMASQDLGEGLKAFLERRAPVWTGR